jgi:hypothetical protein
MDTYVNVKLLLPPRQSRGISQLISGFPHRGFPLFGANDKTQPNACPHGKHQRPGYQLGSRCHDRLARGTDRYLSCSGNKISPKKACNLLASNPNDTFECLHGEINPVVSYPPLQNKQEKVF